MGDWSFDKPLAIGDKLIFEDMIHYTIVKTNMFNGIPHPSLALWNKDNQLVMYVRSAMRIIRTGWIKNKQREEYDHDSE